MKTFLRKISSRKLWTAVIGIIAGLGIAFGADGGSMGTVAGAVMSVVSAVTYIVTEGKIDAAAVKDAAEKVQNAADSLK